jgi:hypothetical protein
LGRMNGRWKQLVEKPYPTKPTLIGAAIATINGQLRFANVVSLVVVAECDKAEVVLKKLIDVMEVQESVAHQTRVPASANIPRAEHLHADLTCIVCHLRVISVIILQTVLASAKRNQ